jgi:hypothetical protein
MDTFKFPPNNMILETTATTADTSTKAPKLMG